MSSQDKAKHPASHLWTAGLYFAITIYSIFFILRGADSPSIWMWIVTAVTGLCGMLYIALYLRERRIDHGPK